MPDYLPNAEPFFFPGNRIGCLLVHGFTGTPYEMRELGTRLAARGYTVLGPALAGHATSLEEMARTRWQDWYGTVTTAYDQLREECDAVVPIGLSLGALLSLHLAAHRPVNAVVAVSPPFGVHNPLIPLFRTFPFLFNFIPLVKKNPSENDTQDPSVAPRHPEYDATPTACAASLIFDLFPHLRGDLRDIRAPLLLIQSRNDRVIPPDSITLYNAQVGSTVKQVVWVERSGHLVLEDFEKEKAFACIIDFLRTHVG